MELINLLLGVTLFIVMIGVGSSIDARKLKKIFQRPKKLILGLALQVLIFPIFAFLIAYMSNLPPEYKVGIIILAACPGGATSNFISYLIKGNTELSVSLTSINSIVILLTIPIYISLGFLAFFNNSISVNLPILSIISQILILAIIPVLIGIILRYYKEERVLSLQKYFKIISSILLITFFTVKFISSKSVLLSKDIIMSILPWALVLNIGGLFLGYVSSKLFKLSNRISTTMGIEIGAQNTILALLITDVILLQPAIGHPALIYATFSFWTALFFGLIFVKNKEVKHKIINHHHNRNHY